MSMFCQHCDTLREECANALLFFCDTAETVVGQCFENVDTALTVVTIM